MKKITAIAAMLGLGYLGAFEMPKLEVKTSVGFDSEYVYRGVKRGQQVFLPKAEMSLPVFEGAKLYVGVEAALTLKDIKETFVGQYSFARTDLYIGMTYKVNEMFAVDVGYDHYFYTNVRGWNDGSSNIASRLDSFNNDDADLVAQARDAARQLRDAGFMKTDMNQIYVGIMADVVASPSLYLSYDFDCREFVVEGKAVHSFNLGKFGLNNFAAEFSGQIGFDYAQRPLGLKGIHQAGKDETRGDKYYFYYGAAADLVYSLNENATIRAGVACEGNSTQAGSALNTMASGDAMEGHKNMIFFRSSVDCAF